MFYVAIAFGKGREINWVTSDNGQQGKSDQTTGGLFTAALTDHVPKKPSHIHRETVHEWYKLSFNPLFEIMHLSHQTQSILTSAFPKDWHLFLSPLMLLPRWLKITTEQPAILLPTCQQQSTTHAAGSQQKAELHTISLTISSVNLLQVQ